MIASWTCPWCGEGSHKNGEACPIALREIEAATPRRWYGPEHPDNDPLDRAPSPPSDNQSPAGALGAKPSNDGPSRDVHAPGNQTERIAFEVKRFNREGTAFDHSWRIFESGRTEGFEAEGEKRGVISMNRIPRLVAEARADSWAECVASMAERRPRPRPPRGHQPDDPEIRWWAGFGCGVATIAIIVVLAVLLGFR